MKSYAIVIKDHPISEYGFLQLGISSEQIGNSFLVERFDAIVPETVEFNLNKYNLKWNYPWDSSMIDILTNLRKSPYGELNPLRRIACSLSHYSLWNYCAITNEPLLILEHDAIFIKKIEYISLLKSNFGIIGINDPHESTFGANVFDSIIQSKPDELQQPPMLTSKDIPQGLAGNSAYLIKPFAAKHLISLCNSYGLWPNDAIMCQQLCTFLGVTKTYYTKSQNLKSTTTLER